jgi:hypothetical protein
VTSGGFEGANKDKAKGTGIYNEHSLNDYSSTCIFIFGVW